MLTLKGKNEFWCERTKKSIQSRVAAIQKAAKKLHACIKQCENRRPSGASNDDIVSINILNLFRFLCII